MRGATCHTVTTPLGLALRKTPRCDPPVLDLTDGGDGGLPPSLRGPHLSFRPVSPLCLPASSVSLLEHCQGSSHEKGRVSLDTVMY